MNDTDALQLIGTLIQQARMQEQISQIKFADKSGVNVQTIRAMERGERLAYPHLRAKIEVSLGWRAGSIQEIWDDRENLVPENVTLDEMTRGFDEESFTDIEAGTQGKPVQKASMLSDEELLAELSYRFRNYKVRLNGES